MKATPKNRSRNDRPARLTLRDVPFRCLIEEDRELKDLRRRYESVSATSKRQAALYEYEKSLATEMFNEAISRLPGGCGLSTAAAAAPCQGAVLALAIDPTCAAALLTVGSVEYQLGRVAEAMRQFLTLTTLPSDADDLPEIIDKAGSFLTDQGDFENAASLYASAAGKHPAVALYHNALGYCVGQLGRHEQAIEHSRRAVELRPEDCRLLSDLGWSLMEAGRYNEAEEVLNKASDLSPRDYELARNNLTELHRRRKLQQQKESEH